MRKPRRFVYDRAGEIREITRHETASERCLRTCRSIYREDKVLYCNYMNHYVFVEDDLLYRNHRCKEAEKEIEELCSEKCRCKECKNLLNCCMISNDFCDKYKGCSDSCEKFVKW